MRISVFGLSAFRGRHGLVLAAVVAAAGLTVPALAQDTNRTGDESVVDIPPDATVDSLFKDFLHYARMGRFTIADAAARALLAHPELDPVQVLELANRDRKSVDTLLILINNSSIGENAARVLELIQKGEHEKRQNKDRIRANIENLGKGPQQEMFAIEYLVDSGEYAIPPIVDTLLDPAKAALRPRIVTALAQAGKPAVTPLAMALSMQDNDNRIHLIRALGEIGYSHALPYLHKLIADASMPEATKRAAAEAIGRIAAITGRPSPGSADDHFMRLAEKYYDENDLVRADPRLDTVNVWYWDDSVQGLESVVVPERIFGQVMAMRCCQEALRLSPGRADAIALWLAANIRREHRLGLNTESGDPDETGDPDATRPDVFPRALYFTQASGPRYAHMVLARAVKDNDTAVALGAIEALRVTAGEASLVGTEDFKQPLVQALRFPDLSVRIRAALALGAALPRSPFADSQYVMPLLAQAVNLTGNEEVVVVDPDQGNLNRVMAALRATGREVIGETDFYRAMERTRREIQSLGGLFISSDAAGPGLIKALVQLRAEFVYSKTPVVVLTKPQDSLMVEDMAKVDDYLEPVDAAADDAALEAALERVRARTGQAVIDTDLAMSLALEAVDTLRRIAVNGRTVYDLVVAEPALVTALASTDEGLQTASASVLALVPTPSAQGAVARMALDATNANSLRLAAFDSLSESAKNHGNLLGDDQLAELIKIARDEVDLTMRTAASQTLGALNLSTSKASDIIRSYHGG